MEEITLFGAGRSLETVYSIVKKLGTYKVIEIWDNSDTKANSTILIQGDLITVKKPYYDDLHTILIVPERYEADIRSQLETIGIRKENIKNWKYCFHEIKDQIREKYKNGDKYERAIVQYLKNHDLRVYNGEWYDREPDSLEVFFDEEKQLYYGVRNDKRIYLKKRYNTPELAINYLKNIEKEQYKESPHRYSQNGFYVKDHDVVLDGGAAEGFFTIDCIEKIDKAYLVECDPEWIEALQYTFEPYRDKVEIISKFLGSINDDKHITIDMINNNDEISYIKLDIEGSEREAFEGASRTFDKDGLTIIACAYHRSNDAEVLSRILLKNGFRVQFSKDYMFFDAYEEIQPELRKALVFADNKGLL